MPPQTTSYPMRKLIIRASLLSAVLLTSSVPKPAAAQSMNSWMGTSSGTWSTAGNWSLGVAPSTSPISIADYPGTASLQHTIDLAGATGRVSYGNIFDFVAGGVGYTFTGTAGSVSGFFIRAGGPVNGIVNNDDNAQTFNVPIKLTSNSGIAGAGAGMTFNAAAGDLIFNGNNNAPATPWTINLNGASNLTFTGSANITIGSSGPGQIVNTNVGTFSGIVKNGTGTLTLGGTVANTYNGTTILNQGIILAQKANAFGTGGLQLNGGTLKTGGFGQSLGTLDLEGSATLDFGAGVSALSLANSSAVAWGSGLTLSLVNWTAGTDTLRVGTDATGLTASQLSEIIFSDLPGSPGAQIDANGFITPMSVPEPSAFGLAFLGGLALTARVLSRRRLD